MKSKYIKTASYLNMHEDEIKRDIQNEGFAPIRLSDPPNRVYHRHKHPETKLLAVVRGSMELIIGDQGVAAQAGDKIVIPGNIYHQAIIGPGGCTFFWSERR